MKLFISWSGERSRQLGAAFSDWVPTVLQQAKPYFSPDMEKGARWSEDILGALADSRIGVIFLTPENLNSRWIQFEAGAIMKALDKSRVCTVLCGLTPAQIEMPLGLFQATQLNKEDFGKLLRTINSAQEETIRIEDSRLQAIFDRFWPDFEAKTKAILGQKPAAIETQKRAPNEMLEELVVSNRRIMSRLDDIESAVEDVADVRPTRGSILDRMLPPQNPRLSAALAALEAADAAKAFHQMGQGAAAVKAMTPHAEQLWGVQEANASEKHFFSAKDVARRAGNKEI